LVITDRSKVVKQPNVQKAVKKKKKKPPKKKKKKKTKKMPRLPNELVLVRFAMLTTSGV